MRKKAVGGRRPVRKTRDLEGASPIDESFDKLVAVLTVVMAVGVAIFAFGFGRLSPMTFLISLIVGLVSLVATVGSLCLVLGICENARRTAAALEELARKTNSKP